LLGMFQKKSDHSVALLIPLCVFPLNFAPLR
jgi:hypothetical protein